jgi:two-component system, NarL family, sensor histidine kinase DevS
MVTLTREQLENRLAALHRASQQLVSDLSRNNVLERIARTAQEQVNARYAAIGIVDEKGALEKFIQVGMTDEEVARMAHPPKGLGLIGALLQEKHTLRVAEIGTDERSVGFPKHHPPMDAFLGVPIMSGGKMLGQIYLTNKENAPEFTEDDERVIETLAAYAAIAIQNSRLYEGVVERDQTLMEQFDDLTLLYNLAKASARSSSMNMILEQTLDQVVSHFSVDAGEVFLREEDSDILQLHMHRGDAALAFWSCERFKFGEGFVGLSAQQNKTIESPILQKDVVCLRPALTEAGFKRIICIPLRASSKVVGVMTVACKKCRQYSWRELDLLEAIGTWTGTAIENARLQQQNRRIAILEERERIGMDLHDGIIQSIYSVGLALDYARMSLDEDVKVARQKISEGIEGLNSTIQDIRAYILDLRPRQLRGGESLPHGVQRLLDEFRKNARAKTTLATSENGFSTLPRQNALALFHICQESLANVAKHACAFDVEVQLWATDEQVLLKVSDDGRGFDIEVAGETIGHGLSNMKRRARKVGGDIKITSGENDGTTVLAWVPWKDAQSTPKGDS